VKDILNLKRLANVLGSSRASKLEICDFQRETDWWPSKVNTYVTLIETNYRPTWEVQPQTARQNMSETGWCQVLTNST